MVKGVKREERKKMRRIEERTGKREGSDDVMGPGLFADDLPSSFLSLSFPLPLPDNKSNIMTDSDTIRPQTMKAWLYSATSGGIENHLAFNPSANAPSSLERGQALIQVISTSLNPADYKVPEMGVISKVVISTPASPGMDFCGRIVAAGPGVDDTKLGKLVYGSLGKPTQLGTLGEYIVGKMADLAELPEGVDPDHAATMGVAGQTAYQSIAPYVSAGDKVFVNGGSGGCGMYVIQIAKALGCYVTTTCSTRNVEFCKELGADEVIDYTTEDVLGVLKKQGQVYSHAIDHIGSPGNLYNQSHTFLLPKKTFVQVGAASMLTFANRLVRPELLGGGKRRYVILLFKNNREDLMKLGEWIQNGEIKVAIDSVFDYEQAVEALKKLRTGRARGKIIIRVSEKPSD